MATNQQRLSWISQASSQYHVPQAVLIAIAIVESKFGQNEGPSSAGAVGFMQIEPATAQQLGVDPRNDQQAIFGAAKLLNQYGYQKDPNRAIAAYNAGPGNVSAGAGYAANVQKLVKQLNSGTFTGFGGQNLTKTGGTLGSIEGAIGAPVTGPANAAASAASSVSDAIGGVWNSIVKDAKYAAVLVALLALGVFLIFHGVSGVASGGDRQRSYVPVPV